MDIMLKVLEIVTPVFALAGVGFAWVKLGYEYRVQFGLDPETSGTQALCHLDVSGFLPLTNRVATLFERNHLHLLLRFAFPCTGTMTWR